MASVQDVETQLDILRCPETGTELHLVDAETIEAWNERIRDGNLRDISGEPIQETLGGALRPEDAPFVYPIRGGVPNFLVSDRLLIDRLERPRANV